MAWSISLYRISKTSDDAFAVTTAPTTSPRNLRPQPGKELPMTQTNYLRRSICILALTLCCISIASAQSVVANIKLGRTPNSLAVNPATNLIYSASRQPRSIQVVNGATNTISADVPLNFEPEDIAVNPTTNRIYAVSFIQGLFVLDGATNTVVANVSLPLGSIKIGVNSVTNKIYVGNSVTSTITVVDGNLNSPTENTIVTVIPVLSYFGGDICPNTVTNRIWLGLSGFDFPAQSFVPLGIIDGANNTLTDRLFIDSFPGSVAINEATDRVYLVNGSSHDVDVIDGPAKTFLTSVDLNVELFTTRIAANPTTNHVFVSEPFGQVVHIVDAGTNTLIVRLGLDLFGPFPQSLAVNPATSFVYVANTGFDPLFDHGGQSISVIDDPPPPASQLQALIQKVKAYNLAQGVANSLDSKLQNALAALDSLNNGNLSTVCNKLDSFINEVEAKNQLTQTQATELINAAKRIKRTLGCSN
jgi:DNA-binding beta-propeller fold protein YncE